MDNQQTGSGLYGDLFAACRERVTALDAARLYGMEIHSGRALCPWHDDHHPSLHFYRNRCHCFACGRGGSSIDLVMQLFGLPPKEAARKLNLDFGLGLEPESAAGSPDHTARAAQKNRQNPAPGQRDALDALEGSLQQDFRCWRRTLLQEVTDVIRAVHAMRPVCPEEISDGQALALREMQVLEQYWTLLADERPAAAAEVWQERARLKRLLRQIGKTWNCFS